jgi:hypothetical protein
MLLKKIYTDATKEMAYFKIKQFGENSHIHSV